MPFFILLCWFVSSSSAAGEADRASMPVEYLDGYAAGQLAARDHAVEIPENWFGTGLISGSCLGPPGCIGATLAGGYSDLNESLIPDLGLQAQSWQEGYRLGYRSVIRQRRARRAFVGGTVGTAVLGVVFLGLSVNSLNNASNSFLSGWGG